jgi:hypothetical protein
LSTLTEPRVARSRTSVIGSCAEIAAYIIAIALVLWPAVRHGSTQMVGGSDDARYYTWLGWRVGRLIGEGHLIPLRIGDVIAPFGLELRLLDGYLPIYVSGLFNLLTGPVLAYNLTFVTGGVLNVLAARSLGRRVSPHRIVHVLGAVAFLTAPPIALGVQLGLLPLFWAFTLPLFVADALDVVTGTRGVRPLRLAVLLVLAFLCSVYFLVFGGLAYGLIVGVAAWRERRWRIPASAALAVVAALIVVLPFVVTRLRFEGAERRAGGTTQLLADSNLYSADALSIVAQPTRSTFLAPRPTVVYRSLSRLPDPRHALEVTTFPGLALLVGFGAFLASPDRRRAPLAIAAIVTWVLGLGPSLKLGGEFLWQHHADAPVSWLPYRLLLAVPGFGSLRAPDRTAYALVAILTGGAAIALHRFVARGRNTVVVGVIATAMLATNLLLPLPTATVPTTDASERAMREIAERARDGDTVLSLPFDCDPTFSSYQILHRAPVLGCAGSFAANPWRSKMVAYTRSEALSKLRCDDAQYGRIPTSDAPTAPFDEQDVAELRQDFGARFVVVDRARIGLDCASVAQALTVIGGHRSLGKDERFEVFDLAERARQ